MLELSDYPNTANTFISVVHLMTADIICVYRFV